MAEEELFPGTSALNQLCGTILAAGCRRGHKKGSEKRAFTQYVSSRVVQPPDFVCQVTLDR